MDLYNRKKINVIIYYGGSSHKTSLDEMTSSWISVLLLAICLEIVKAEFNPAICDIIKESYGLMPPPLPTNFELKAEYVDNNEKYVKYEEMYFDYTNSRAKYMFLLKGIEHHVLFDYEVQQVVEYDLLHPGGTIKDDPLSRVCTATDIDFSEYRDIFGFLESTIGGKPKTFGSSGVLRFGGKYRHAFNGSTKVSDRGIFVDKFIGCLYDDSTGATIDSEFLFSSKQDLGVGAAGGTKEAEVTGIDNGLLSVPVRANLYGSITSGPFNGTSETSYFNRSINYFWFKGEPEFEMETFKIPSYLYCTNYKGRKEMKKFPTAFGTRIQRTSMEKDILGKLVTNEVTSFETVHYYKEKLLARRDYSPGPLDTEIKSKFTTLSPVRTIYDFNQGLLYVTNIASGRCFIRPIEYGDFFETSQHLLYITMGNPEEIFQMQTDKMEYKGKDLVRDINCDVWSGKYFDKTYNATYMKETYISTDGWHEEVEEESEYGVPVKHVIIQKELNGEPMEGVTALSFLKFKAKPPVLQNFDVSNCIDSQKHRDFAILLTVYGNTKQLLFKYRLQFLEAAQYYINEVAQLLSPLRVQRLQYRLVSSSDSRPILLVTLVDHIELKTKIPVGQLGASLTEAVANLQKFIDRNQFAIKFYPPYSKEPTMVRALRGSLYVKTSDGDLTYFAPMREVSPVSNVKNPSRIMFDNPLNADEEESKGMSSGSLALLAFAMLFIGIGIGVAVMYLYLRYQSDSKLEDRIHLSLQSSVEVPKNPDIEENF